MKTTQREPDTQRRLGLTEDEYNKLVAAADMSDRSVAAEIRVAIRTHLSLIDRVKRGPVTLTGTDTA